MAMNIQHSKLKEYYEALLTQFNNKEISKEQKINISKEIDAIEAADGLYKLGYEVDEELIKIFDIESEMMLCQNHL